MPISILEDVPTKELLGTTITDYLSHNTDTASSSLIEWEALKVVVRGACIHNSIGAKHALVREIQQVEESLLELEMAAVSDSTKVPRLQEACTQHTLLLDRLRCLDVKAYIEREHREGNKSGWLLAWLARTDHAIAPILSIVDIDGSLKDTQEQINGLFQKYYSNLYSCKSQINLPSLRDFLDRVVLPQFLADLIEELASPNSVQNIKQAIRSLPRGKTPGTDERSKSVV